MPWCRIPHIADRHIGISFWSWQRTPGQEKLPVVDGIQPDKIIGLPAGKIRSCRKSKAVSILPYEDCCTVFTPKHPKTKPSLGPVEAEEAKLDVAGLIARAIENTEKIQVRWYEN